MSMARRRTADAEVVWTNAAALTPPMSTLWCIAVSVIKLGATPRREDARLVALERGLVSLNGDGHWLGCDCRLHVLDAGSEKEIAHALVTGDATLDDGGQRLSLTALNSSTGTSRRRGGVQGTRTGLHSSILLNCLLLVLPLVIRAELFPSVRRSIVWVDTSASRHPHLP